MKGTVYFARVSISFRRGRSKAPIKTKADVGCVGFNRGDALARMVANPDRLRHLLKKLGDIKDLKIHGLEILCENGLTVYELEPV
jgi:hypothetical protein